MGSIKQKEKSSERTNSTADEKRAPAVEKIRIDKGNKEYNSYYLKISRGYKAAKFITLALFLAYLIFMMCTYRSAITYDNLMYLVRDFETDIDVSSRGFEGIVYPAGEKMSFSIYKDRLARATVSDFTLYNTTGSVELDYDHSMENPAVETGDKYALVYDIGGTSYSLYNTIARVSTKHTEYAIQGADICDSGAFALITRSKENRYVVTVYDSAFKELTRVYKDKYVTDVSVNDKGDRYAIVSCDVDGNDLLTEIMCAEVRAETGNSFTLEGLLPLSAEWFGDGSFVVVCDGAAVFVSEDGVLKKRVDFGDMKIVTSYVTKNRLLITGSENSLGSSSKGMVFDTEGNIIMSFGCDGKISSAVLSDNYAFYLSGEKIFKTDMNGETVSAESPAYAKTLVPCFDNVAVCTDTGVVMGFDKAVSSGNDSGTSAEAESEQTEQSEETFDVTMDTVES